MYDKKDRMDNEEKMVAYSAAFLWVGLLVAFVGGYAARSSVGNVDNFISPVPSVKAIYVYPQTLQIYGTGENPKYQLPPISKPSLPSRQAIENYVCSDKFKWDCSKIKRIIFCESTYREKVVSRTGDVGVMQIAPVHGYSATYLSDYHNNTDVGYKLFLKRGYQPWKSSIKCWGKLK